MGAPATLPYAFLDVPGLTLEAMTAAHLDEAAALLVEALPHYRCDGECWTLFQGFGEPEMCQGGPHAHARDALAQDLTTAGTWCLVWAFEGRALQYEILTVDEAARAATIELTLRGTRERPEWFWREAARPVFEALAAATIERVSFWTGAVVERAGRDWARSWLPFYRNAFGAEKTADFGRGGSRRYEFPVSPARFTGWPARRTAGPGWQWTGPRVSVREATEAELPWIETALAAIWGPGHPAVATVQRLLHEQWALDRAAVLLGFTDDALTDVHAYRPRTDTLVNDAILTRVRDPRDDAPQRLLRQGVTAWCQRVGYAELSGHIPDAVYDRPAFRRYLQQAGARIAQRHTHYRTPMVEIRVDLRDPDLQRPARWDAWESRAELPLAAAIPRTPRTDAIEAALL